MGLFSSTLNIVSKGNERIPCNERFIGIDPVGGQRVGGTIGFDFIVGGVPACRAVTRGAPPTELSPQLGSMGLIQGDGKVAAAVLAFYRGEKDHLSRRMMHGLLLAMRTLHLMLVKI